MAKKTVKQPPHLRVRIDPKLLARLEKARETNGNTLTGEIVCRLEESFSTADRIAMFRLAHEQRIEDLRRMSDEARAFAQAARKEFDAENLKVRTEFAEKSRGLEAEIDKLQVSATVIDALIGNDVATKEAVRNVAILLAANPGWASNSDAVQKVSQAAFAAVKSAADKGHGTQGQYVPADRQKRTGDG
jgi:hypothetical protein